MGTLEIPKALWIFIKQFRFSLSTSGLSKNFLEHCRSSWSTSDVLRGQFRAFYKLLEALQIFPNHFRSSQIISDLPKITLDLHKSLRIFSKSLQIFPKSLQIIANHFRSSQITSDLLKITLDFSKNFSIFLSTFDVFGAIQIFLS